eukprot:356133-Chlamydomonas_euryale.AAC.13
MEAIKAAQTGMHGRVDSTSGGRAASAPSWKHMLRNNRGCQAPLFVAASTYRPHLIPQRLPTLRGKTCVLPTRQLSGTTHAAKDSP